MWVVFRGQIVALNTQHHAKCVNDTGAVYKALADNRYGMNFET
jgi:hypothetical protein